MLGTDDFKYLDLILKRLWVIILTAAIAGGLGYALQSRQEPIYNAEALISIGNPIEFVNQDLIDLREQLARSYLRIVKTTDALSSVAEALGLPPSTDLDDNVSASVVTGTSFMTIGASHTDPQTAADIANAMTEYLEENSISLSTEGLDTLASLEFQINELNQQIEASRQQLKEINLRLEDATEDNETTMLETQRTQVIDQINTALSNVGTFTDTLLELSSRAITVQIIDPAKVPDNASGINPIIIAASSGIVGGILATAALLFFEYINRTIRTEEEIQHALGIRSLATIGKYEEVSKNHSKFIKEGALHTHPIIEGYRNIKASLLFSVPKENKPLIYVVASLSSGEGRTFTATNLAITMSETIPKILLIDADLRNPNLHTLFGLGNKIGVSPLLQASYSASPESISKSLKDNIQKIPNSHLSVMTSGTQGQEGKNNLYNFATLQPYIENIKEKGEYDVIILDVAPSLKIADAYILAGTIEASVILVVEAAKNTREQVIKIKDQFTKLGVPVAGVILNKSGNGS